VPKDGTRVNEIKGQSRNGHRQKWEKKRDERKSWKLKRKRDNENVIKETPEMVFSCWNLI
jgi:hypothetical protein